MKKLVSLLMALCLLLSLFPAALAAEEPITLEFWVRTSDDFSAEIADFEALNPGIKIEQVQVGASYDELVTKYNSAINTKTLPAVGMVGQRHGIPQLYDAGVLIPIEEYMSAEAQADVIDGYWVRYTYKDKRMAVPFQSSIPILHYNATMLKELGLEVPKTFSEMTEAAAKAVKDTNGDGVTDIYGFNMATDYPWYVQSLIWEFGGSLLDENGNAKVDTPETLEVLTAFAKMVKDGVMPANQHATYRQDFANGNLLFFFTTCASVSAIEELVNGKFDYEIAFFPAEDTLDVSIGGNGLAIFASTPEKQEAAWKFIQYMISPEPFSKTTMERGYLPCTKAHFASPLVTERLADPTWKTILDLVEYIKGQSVHPADSIIWNEMLTLVSQIEADPDMDIAQALKDFQVVVDEYMMFY